MTNPITFRANIDGVAGDETIIFNPDQNKVRIVYQDRSVDHNIHRSSDGHYKLTIAQSTSGNTRTQHRIDIDPNTRTLNADVYKVYNCWSDDAKLPAAPTVRTSYNATVIKA